MNEKPAEKKFDNIFLDKSHGKPRKIFEKVIRTRGAWAYMCGVYKFPQIADPRVILRKGIYSRENKSVSFTPQGGFSVSFPVSDLDYEGENLLDLLTTVLKTYKKNQAIIDVSFKKLNDAEEAKKKKDEEQKAQETNTSS